MNTYTHDPQLKSWYKRQSIKFLKKANIDALKVIYIFIKTITEEIDKEEK